MFPLLSVETPPTGYDPIDLLKTQPQMSGVVLPGTRRGPFAVKEAVLPVEPGPLKELFVIKQNKSRRYVPVQFDFRLDLKTVSTGDEQQRGGGSRIDTLRLQDSVPSAAFIRFGLNDL